MYWGQNKTWVAGTDSRMLVKEQVSSIEWWMIPKFTELLRVSGILLLMLGEGVLVTELYGDSFLRQTADIWVLGNCISLRLILYRVKVWLGHSNSWFVFGNFPGLKEQNSAFCWCFSVKVNIEDEAWATLKELVEEKKIEEKYIVNFLESGNGNICFHNISYQETNQFI